MKYTEYDDIKIGFPVVEGKKVPMRIEKIEARPNRWGEIDPDSNEEGTVITLQLKNEELVTSTDGEELSPGGSTAFHDIYIYQRPDGPDFARGDCRKGIKANLVAIFGPEDSEGMWLKPKEKEADWCARIALEGTGRSVLADLKSRADKNDATKFYQQVDRLHAAS